MAQKVARWPGASSVHRRSGQSCIPSSFAPCSSIAGASLGSTPPRSQDPQLPSPACSASEAGKRVDATHDIQHHIKASAPNDAALTVRGGSEASTMSVRADPQVVNRSAVGTSASEVGSDMTGAPSRVHERQHGPAPSSCKTVSRHRSA